MKTKEKRYQNFVSSLHSKVDSFLSDEHQDLDEVEEIIVLFCIFTEKTVKTKLYQKNPILCFDLQGPILKDVSLLASITLGKKIDTTTCRKCNFSTILERFEKVFPRIFTNKEITVLKSISKERNEIVHDYFSKNKDLLNAENLVKKMSEVWPKVSGQGRVVFGKDVIKMGKTPKKLYSQEELDAILESEVEVKLNQGFLPLSNTLREVSFASHDDSFVSVSGSDEHLKQNYMSVSYALNEECPRCGRNSFSQKFITSAWSSADFTKRKYGDSDFYECGFCGLELTKTEYEIAKKLLKRL